MGVCQVLFSYFYNYSSLFLSIILFLNFLLRILSKAVCDIVDKALCLFPAEAGVGYGFTVYFVRTDLLAAVLDIAFDHKSLHDAAYVL